MVGEMELAKMKLLLPRSKAMFAKTRISYTKLINIT